MHDGELFGGGRYGKAVGDGGEALLALQLALANAGPDTGDDDAEDHGAAGDGHAEGAVEGFVMRARREIIAILLVARRLLLTFKICGGFGRQLELCCGGYDCGGRRKFQVAT